MVIRRCGEDTVLRDPLARQLATTPPAAGQPLRWRDVGASQPCDGSAAITEVWGLLLGGATGRRSSSTRTNMGLTHAAEFIFRQALPELYFSSVRDIKRFVDHL